METTALRTIEKISFTPDQVDLIKKQIAPKATDDELKLFLYQSQRTGLDPLARQIYCIHRKQKQGNVWIEKMTVQTSIDGFRVVAERSGDYGGQDEPEFVHNAEGKLICCKVKVYKFRGDQRYQASVGVAYWDEYVPGEGMDYMWRKMPHTMLSKVAEALALRKAFPQDLSGLYTMEEMQQADTKEQTFEAAQPQQPALPERTVDDMHKEYMVLLNRLVELQGEDARRFDPDNWKKERNQRTYNAAIADIKNKIFVAEGTVAEGTVPV